jgi:hypothetical protein
MPVDRLGALSLGWRDNNSESVVVMGASNLAARRGAKANRRKAIVAEKRKAEALSGTVAGQVARAAGLPLRHCLLAETLFEVGMGTLVLVRGSAVGPVTVATFLLDTACCGVKDVMFRTMEQYQLRSLVDHVNDVTPVTEVDPAYARKLIHDLVCWSASLGFHPPREFAAAERLFGSVDARACDASFEFGMGGKPLYVSGPKDSLAASRERVADLGERLGTDGFHYIVTT